MEKRQHRRRRFYPSFPYAGITRFRFEGLISGLAATPNGIIARRLSLRRPSVKMVRAIHVDNWASSVNAFASKNRA
jgi:hypothetical protein